MLTQIMMLRFNLVKFFFVIMAFGMLILSLLINFLEPCLPLVLVQMFRYGKFSYINKKSYINHLEVPKSWFRHFYIVATIYSIIVVYLIIRTYFFSLPAPQLYVELLNFLAMSDRTASTNATNICLAMILLCFQLWRRLYETFFVSVFSNCKINVIHYFIGMAHYIFAITALIMEAPLFSAPSFKYKSTLSMSDIGLTSVIGIIIFTWAWFSQYKTAVILANLRKDKTGTVVNYDHKLPVGGLFERLSSPHMFCEMLIYLALNFILWGNSIWPYVFFWVFCNQCEAALLSHWWYKSKFKTYPKKRKAFLPFVL